MTRVLHVLDHSLPLHSGYTFRTRAILREQRKLGWETFHLTSPKQVGCSVDEETVDGLHFYRTPADDGLMARLRPGDPRRARATGECVLRAGSRSRPFPRSHRSPATEALAP